MSDAIVTFDANGNPVLMPVQKARKARPKRKPPTPAELGLAPAPKAKPTEPEPSAADQAATDRFYRDYERRRAAFFSSTSEDGMLAPEVRHHGEILFSDTGSGSSQSRAAIRVSEAAKQAGLSEDDFTTRLVGKARLKMVNGELVVSVADVNRLAKAGKLPKPSDVRETQTAVAEAEGKLSTDPAVEARAAGAAAAIGIDIGPAKTDAPRAGVATAKASGRASHRLGAPQRWSAAR